MGRKQAKKRDMAPIQAIVESPRYFVIYILHEVDNLWTRTGVLIEAPHAVETDEVIQCMKSIEIKARQMEFSYASSRLEMLSSADVVEGLPYVTSLCATGAIATLFAFDGVSDSQINKAETLLIKRTDLASLSVAKIHPLKDWEPLPPFKLCLKMPDFIRIEGQHENRDTALA